MIFSVDGHIEMIRNGLYSIFTDEKGDPMSIVKTHTRRLNRGIYQVGRDYAVQRKRGIKAEPDIRIVMDRIWEEKAEGFLILAADDEMYPGENNITKEDALVEGGYTPEEFERVFRELNPGWDGWSRWAFEFHVIEARKTVPGITSHAREERVERTFYPEDEEREIRKNHQYPRQMKGECRYLMKGHIKNQKNELGEH